AMATLKNRFISALSASERRGPEAEDEYFRRAREYDPTAAVTTAAQGAWAQIAPERQEDLRDLRGRLVPTRRLRGRSGELEMVGLHFGAWTGAALGRLITGTGTVVGAQIAGLL